MNTQADKLTLDVEEYRPMLEAALGSLAEEKGGDIARQVKPILLANLDRGRLKSFADGSPERVRAYIWLVADKYSELNPYLHQLQTEQSRESWEPLFERIQTWAYNFFLRKNFAADDHTREIAIECATEAAIILLKAHFPYDTEFAPWAHVITQNTCRKFIHKAFKKSVVPEDKKIELEDSLANPHELLVETMALQQEAGDELMEALEQLSEARRTVIQSIYLDEIEPDEIAKKMKKTVGAVYSLHFNALNDLRKILSENRDKLNE
ncbi:MAG TPA: sigma-70 family RNA polymerase sigma factor [Anaerolineales bacterium]|nr:sigma-70 family RNA polymerase sigma factor [Anaerolineales bacterium]